jgi:hypothetical protein
MLHNITSSTIADLMYIRIRDLEESPCARMESTRKSTKDVVDHMWSIMHGMESQDVVNIDHAMTALAHRAAVSPDWAEQQACNETYGLLRAAAHA